MAFSAQSNRNFKPGIWVKFGLFIFFAMAGMLRMPTIKSQTHADVYVLAMAQNRQYHMFGIRHNVAVNLTEVQNRGAVDGDDDITFFDPGSGGGRMRECANDLHGGFIA